MQSSTFKLLLIIIIILLFSPRVLKTFITRTVEFCLPNSLRFLPPYSVDSISEYKMQGNYIKRATIEERVKKIIAEQLGVKEEEVSSPANL